jgi:hypothetical protein
MTPAWLTPGATCRTRNGGKAIIYAVDVDGAAEYEQVHGHISGDPLGWRNDGRFRTHSTGWDLVGPWVEEVKT